jgi:hypothetical protein
LEELTGITNLELGGNKIRVCLSIRRDQEKRT